MKSSDGVVHVRHEAYAKDLLYILSTDFTTDVLPDVGPPKTNTEECKGGSLASTPRISRSASTCSRLPGHSWYNAVRFVAVRILATDRLWDRVEIVAKPRSLNQFPFDDCSTVLLRLKEGRTKRW